MNSKNLEIKINTVFKILPITFWDAIKLRVAGKNYQKLFESLSEEIRSKIDKLFGAGG